ncbi:MAG: IclR family transcriptional regulator [Chloroflexota bacterium]
MQNVQSVERISAILNTIATHQDGAGVTEIAQQIDLPVSTVSRFLLALETVNFVERESASDGFRIGSGIFDLAAQADFPQYLIKIARPYMVELAQFTGEAVTLTILKDNQIYCIAQVPGQYNLQLQNWVGQHFPLHTSANGKVTLAFLPKDQQDHYLSQPLEQITPNSITDSQQLRQQLAQIRQTGYAWTQDEYEEGLIALASPIQTETGQLVAAIGIGAPTFRFPLQDEWRPITDKLIKVGQTIGEQIQR